MRIAPKSIAPAAPPTAKLLEKSANPVRALASVGWPESMSTAFACHDDGARPFLAQAPPRESVARLLRLWSLNTRSIIQSLGNRELLIDKARSIAKSPAHLVIEVGWPGLASLQILRAGQRGSCGWHRNGRWVLVMASLAALGRLQADGIGRCARRYKPGGCQWGFSK